MKTNCPSCNRSYDVPAVTGKYICECGQEYRISHDGLISAGVSQPAVIHHCPDCEGLGRVSDILNGISIHKCPNCGGTGKIILSDIILRDQPQATHHCPGCEAAARERDDLRAGILRVIEDYPRAIKQDAEEALRALVADTVAPVSGDSDLRARLAAEIDKMDTTAMEAYAEGQSEVVSAMQPHLDELRALLAETEAK